MTTAAAISESRIAEIVAAAQAEQDRYDAANAAAGGYDDTISQNVWEHVLYPLPEYDAEATESLTGEYASECAVLTDGTLIACRQHQSNPGRIVWYAERDGVAL